MRIARPGPGNGWRATISSGRPSSRPTARTSSLNSSRSGSTSLNLRSSGSPPTLWWLLMFAVPEPPPDSTTSGYSVPCTRKSTSDPVSPTMSRTAPSNARMNSRPMILRLPSGLVTPESASRNRSATSTVTRLAPVAATKSRCTCARSPARSRPWSTNTHVSRSPMARCTSAAATAESTPPDRPQIARPSPIWSRTCSTSAVGDVRGRPGRVDAGEFVQEPAQHLLAVRGVHHLGVVLHACQPARRVLERRDGCTGAAGHHLEALRCGGDGVAVAHPHRLGLRQVRMQLSTSDIQLGAAVLAGAGVGDGAAEGLRHRLKAVADAEHRNTEVEHRGVQLRRTRLRTHSPGRRTARWPADPWP